MYERSRSRQLPRDPESDPTSPRPMFRQGDVLLVAVLRAPEGCTPIPDEGGRHVLAHGEATGHAHAVEEREARTFTHEGERYLLTKSKAQLIHEEHAPIAVPPGAYRVVIQREYEPDPIRNVTPSQQWRRVVD